MRAQREAEAIDAERGTAWAPLLAAPEAARDAPDHAPTDWDRLLAG
ncbi:MAG: hypothetical protein ACK58T_18905 [Phycisphaerae bacterium]